MLLLHRRLHTNEADGIFKSKESLEILLLLKTG